MWSKVSEPGGCRHPFFVGELIPGHLLARCERVRAAGEYADRVLEQRPVLEFGVGRRERRQARKEQVELAGLEQLDEHVLVGLPDQDERFGVRIQQARERRRQDPHPPAPSRDSSHAQRPARAAGDDLDVRYGQTQLAEDRAGAPDEAFAVLSRRDPTSRPVEQRHPERGLQLGDRGGDRRLRQVEQLRGLAEASLLGDREQHAQLPQLEMPRKPVLKIAPRHTLPFDLLGDNHIVIGTHRIPYH